MQSGNLKHIEDITDNDANDDNNIPPKLRTFIDQINQDRFKLNIAIDNYNQEENTAIKKNLLNNLKQQIIMVINKYPDQYLAYCPDIKRIIQYELFENLRKQDAYLDSILASQPPNNKRDCSLTKIIERMAPDKFEALLEILNEGKDFKQSKLNSLYKGYELKDEYDDFQAFLKTHQPLTYLGGNNSKNFKVTPLDGSDAYAVKLENRLGQPRTPELHLREHSLKDTLSPIYICRNGTFDYNDEEKNTWIDINRNLIVTNFCPDGDLEAHSNKIPFVAERIESALDIYCQMCEILCAITHDKCAFPDMKNTNWLVDHSGNLTIADTKSLLFTNTKGCINPNTAINEWAGFISTDYVSPPENPYNQTKRPCLADNIHAYMLGKNLYQYLTRCSWKYLESINSHHDFNFNTPVFNSPEGMALQSLIESLVKSDPFARIPVQDALKKLTAIRLDLIQYSFDRYQTFIDQSQQLSDLHESLIACDNLAGVTELKNQLHHKLLNNLQQECIELSNQNYDNDPQEIEHMRQKILTADNLDHIWDIYNDLMEEKLQFACLDLLDKIEQHGFGKNDVKMQQYVREISFQLQMALDTDEQQEIQQKLTLILTQQQHVDIQNIKKILAAPQVDDIRNKIEETVCLIPIEQRILISSKQAHVSEEIENTRTYLDTYAWLISPQINYKKRFIEKFNDDEESSKQPKLDGPANNS